MSKPLDIALREEMRDVCDDDLRRFEMIALRRDCPDLAAMVSAERAHRRDEEERDDA